MRFCFLVCAMITVAFASAQEKGIVGDFTKSPTEHIINQIEQPFTVRSVIGIVTRQTGGPTEPLQNVLFEIQGPGSDRKIRRASSDENGRFKMGRVPSGTYKFKATLNGFQSVMGTIVVSKKASRFNEIKIGMAIGV